MLTEKQFKVLMILFDNKGHAGWELANDLDMKESNLNPFLKRLEKKKFIFQGTPRKSNRPKKSEEIKKREGD
jgi:DNA-binding MarR family transcriptional regulator